MTEMQVLGPATHKRACTLCGKEGFHTVITTDGIDLKDKDGGLLWLGTYCSKCEKRLYHVAVAAALMED
jgi:hypothetical protein